MREEADLELGKDAVREALAVITGLTLREIAARLGVSVSLLYAYADPLRPNQPDPRRMRELAELYRREASRLLAAADRLERVADATDPPIG